MSTSTASNGPQVVAARAQPTPETISAKFDLSIALVLAKWPALTTAVQNLWGGPDSSDKRDWLAGNISDLFASGEIQDQEDLEVVLLQAMADEFDIQLEDESEVEIAIEILRFRKQTSEGRFAAVDEMFKRWEEKQKKGGENAQVLLQGSNENADWSSDDEDEDGGVEIEMTDAPTLETLKENQEPEIDEDGFTKVVSKKRR